MSVTALADIASVPADMLDRPTILKAFGEKTRLRILRLVSVRELAVNELVEALEVPQSRISRHLAVLRRGGLVRDRREGNWIYYSLAAEELEPFAAAVWEALLAHQPGGGVFAADLERMARAVAKREARSKSYFDVVVTEWDRIRRDYIDETFSFVAISSLVRPDAVVADVGAGTGGVLLQLARAAGKVIGVDRSEKMLDVCRQRAAAAGLKNVELRLGDAERLPLADAECDAALSSMLLHHLKDPAAGVMEMARVVKPGGKVVVSDLVKHDCDWTREVMADVWLGFTREQIEEWLSAAGLTRVMYSSTEVPSPVQPESAGKLRAFIASGTRPGE